MDIPSNRLYFIFSNLIALDGLIVSYAHTSIIEETLFNLIFTLYLHKTATSKFVIDLYDNALRLFVDGT